MPAQHAFLNYESIRQILPQWQGNKPCTPKRNLLEIADDFDTFFFDAYGVLNVGSSAIPNAIPTIKALIAQGKQCFIVSNGAGFHKSVYVRKYQKLGYPFDEHNLFNSRDALLQGITDYPKTMRWGYIAPLGEEKDLHALGINLVDQDDPDFLNADGFLFLTPLRWSKEKQEAWKAALMHHPRPILLGNPDLIAPLGDSVSIEAGSYVLTLPEALHPYIRVFGKPFPEIYQTVVKKMEEQNMIFTPKRTLMLGDTLHTDILGGNAFGIKTALISAHGFFKGRDPAPFIAQSGIIPDFILPSI